VIYESLLREEIENTISANGGPVTWAIFFLPMSQAPRLRFWPPVCDHQMGPAGPNGYAKVKVTLGESIGQLWGGGG
jgi:hypothetical protein